MERAKTALVRTLGIGVLAMLAGCATGAEVFDASIDDDGGACVPDCDGRECGDDGCGGTCDPGCMSTQTCSTAGACLDECPSTWRTVLPGVVARDTLLDNDRLIVAGNEGTDGWMGSLAACGGDLGITEEVSHPTAISVDVRALYGDANDYYVVGSIVTAADPRNGMYGRVSKLLSTQQVIGLVGSAGEDTATSVAASADGSLWMTGVADTTGANTMWGIKSTLTGQACGFAGPAPATTGRAIATDGDTVYMLADSQQHILVAVFDGTQCSTMSPCPCAPTNTATIQIGTDVTTAFNAAVVGQDLYIVGQARDTDADAGDFFGFAARLNKTSLQVGGQYKWDPTIFSDGFTDLAVDADTLYLVGGAGWEGGATFDEVVPTVRALPAQLILPVIPDWIAEPTSTILWSVSDDIDGLYVTGFAGGADSVALRCTKSGTCE